MKPKPDNRHDNVERIQKNINHTIKNIEMAEDMMGRAPDENMKKALKEKNDRRQDALDGMREEIRDEAHDRENGYK